MIVVIADDLSGAAEVAGIAYRLGFSVQLFRDYIAQVPMSIDVLVYDTNSRECPANQARGIIRKLAIKLKDYSGLHIFKKIDSTCRGNFAIEIEILMDVMGFEKALIVPASPQTGRAIIGGRIFVNGKPINETDFAKDATYPFFNSDVINIMKSQTKCTISPLHRKEMLTAGDGMFISDAIDADDLSHWAGQVNPRILSAGSAAFFEKYLLQTMGQKNSFSSKHTKEDFNFDKPVLIASGSKHPKSIEQISDFMKKGGKGIGIDVSQKPNIGWVVEQVRQTFKKNPAIVLHIQTQGIDNIDFKNAAIIFGSVVSNVLKEIKPPTLIISGGYSAEMIANQMGWKSFWVKHELFYGLVAMHTEQSGCILFKPGSYFEHNLYSELNLLNW